MRNRIPYVNGQTMYVLLVHVKKKAWSAQSHRARHMSGGYVLSCLLCGLHLAVSLCTCCSESTCMRPIDDWRFHPIAPSRTWHPPIMTLLGAIFPLQLV
jgi:hypothetical protein